MPRLTEHAVITTDWDSVSASTTGLVEVQNRNGTSDIYYLVASTTAEADELEFGAKLPLGLFEFLPSAAGQELYLRTTAADSDYPPEVAVTIYT